MLSGVMDSLDRFLSRMERARDELRRSELKEAIILHHDEADGLTSAALSKLAFEHLGMTTRLICLDKLYPEVVRSIENASRRVIVCVDLGSAHVGRLTQYNALQNMIVILDHHDTVESNDPMVYNLNPELDGFSGESDASAATIAYFFAKFVDPRLSKYAHLAVVGAEEIPGELRGLNKIAVRDALEQGLVKVSRDNYKVEVEGLRQSRSRLAAILNVLGSVGYYRDGPTMGVTSCLSGITESTVEFAKKLEEERKEANKRMLSTINRQGLEKMKMVQWFHAKDNYAGMSGKVVGSFCSYLKFQRQVDQSKYLIGMMNVTPDIPGWGSLPSSLVKVSGRAPRVLSDQIKRRERPALSRILSQACLTAGGFGDGHAVAASGVFPVGREELFLSEMDRMASSK
jgi:single-stranded-DNA-specific exonuclease